jgi:hypothetical protein
MTMTKLKIGIVGLLGVAGITISLVIQYRQGGRLTQENLALRQQVAQLTKIRDAVEKLPTIQPNATNAEALRKQQFGLLRLRGMVGVERQQGMALRQQLDEAQTQADAATFQLGMAQRRPSQGAESGVPTVTPLPGNLDISTLQPAGRDTAADAAQSILYAVFHHAVDAYQGVALNPGPTGDPTYSEFLAQMRRHWGGDAAQGIKNMAIGGPLRGTTNRYMLNFRIDYGANGRPAGYPASGYVTLEQTPDGWKAAGFGFD